MSFSEAFVGGGRDTFAFCLNIGVQVSIFIRCLAGHDNNIHCRLGQSKTTRDRDHCFGALELHLRSLLLELCGRLLLGDFSMPPKPLQTDHNEYAIIFTVTYVKSGDQDGKRRCGPMHIELVENKPTTTVLTGFSTRSAHTRATVALVLHLVLDRMDLAAKCVF